MIMKADERAEVPDDCAATHDECFEMKSFSCKKPGLMNRALVSEYHTLLLTERVEAPPLRRV